MNINPAIFKAYDIRGIYPDDLNEEISYRIGRAFVILLGKKNPKIVVGRDKRLSSDSIFNSLTSGLVDQGAQVIDIGLSTTPLLYFSTAFFNYDGGINITASHNPFNYNGFKLVREGAVPVSGESGIEEIKEMVITNSFEEVKKGKVIKKQVFKQYKDFNLKGFDLKKIKPLKIIFDTANAVPGAFLPEFMKETKCETEYLFLELDGRFPNHEPDPLKKENILALSQEVLQKKADLGIAFDGDGDRIKFVDEKGEPIDGDLVTCLISKLILKERPGEKILYDLRSSNIVAETIKKNGGLALVGRIGHSFIKERMRKEDIFFAGELSGHYYLKDHFFCECPFFVLFKVLETISLSDQTLSEIILPFKKYFNSGEINFKASDKEKVLRELEKKFETGKVSKLDGLRVDFNEWWFLVRPSNTDPVIRLMIEAKTKEILEEKTHLFSDFLHG